MLLELAQLATHITRSDHLYRARVAVADKAMEQQRAAGQGVLALLQAAPPPTRPDLGQQIDLMA